MTIFFVLIFVFFIFEPRLHSRLPYESSVSVERSNESDTVIFLDDFNKAKELSRTERKPLLIFFTLSDNESCKRSFELFSNQEIRRLAKYFICVSVDGALSGAICESYRVNGFPTVLILDADNKEIQRLTGKETKEHLSVQMHIAIQVLTIPGISSEKNKLR
ncbi:MAG: thioredoxin family protein [Planctomycetaceae bacterium]|nr:thioredoxin family protein [Planctomycetaceae bacterium]